MRIDFASHAGTDYSAWQAQDPAMAARIKLLTREILRSPFEGIGKPEALRGVLSGWWSRRIGREHRLVYRVTGSGDARTLEVAQCRYHY